ncbi:MAG: B12-binding domain-containing radical SAM protein, partial [Halobacteriota archaeon]
MTLYHKLMDILLISGPLTDPTIVPLGVPALAAHLRSEGFTVEAWDLSIDSVDMLTSAPFLLEAVARIDRRRADGNGSATKELQRAETLARTLAPIVIDRIEGAKATFRDKEQFYDYSQYKEALWTFQAVTPILHAAYFPTIVDKLCYDLGKEPTVEHILAHLTDPDSNLFLAHFANDVVPKIERMHPPLIALSISWESQLLPSLTLCRLLRERLPDVPIILGGGYVTAMQDRLETEKYLWDFATAIVFHDGESALAEICRRVKDGRDLSHIPNVFFKDDPVRSSSRHTEDMRTLPTPDFTGFHLDRYFFPEPVLAVQSNRGCYWNKCTFCSSANMTRHSYRQRPVEQLVQDMTVINAATGATIFFICDLATPPRYLKHLGEYVHTHELPFQWTTETRFDPDLDEAACRAIAAGGCLNLSFGFESASDRVLALMQK